MSSVLKNLSFIYQHITFKFINKFILLFFISIMGLVNTGCQPLDVPYINQFYDVPSWFDGRYSCGPASVVMVLAYYNLLEPWNLNCNNPYFHVSPYGRYICCIFKVNNFTFDLRQLDASRRYYGYGVHGYVYIPGLGASWNKIVEVFEIFGFQAYIDTDASFDKIVREIDNGYPVIICTQLTSFGHIVVVIGYISNGSVIVNDPAGDLNRGQYFNYYGKDAIYDWPGINNGHRNLNRVNALIIIRPGNKMKKAYPVEERIEEVSYLNIGTVIIVVALTIFIIIAIYNIKELYKKHPNQRNM